MWRLDCIDCEKRQTMCPACEHVHRLAVAETHKISKIECQNHTVEEVVDLLRASGGSFSGVSARRLADWLAELARARRCVYEARAALAGVREYEVTREYEAPCCPEWSPGGRHGGHCPMEKS
jgi:hypothetical protein